MIKTLKDDGAVVPPPRSFGTNAVKRINEKAALIYPDHQASREAYIQEQLADELDRLNAACTGLEARVRAWEDDT